MTADQYVHQVTHHVPRDLPLRDQIAMELRGHIAERLAHGQPIEDILRQLGDPLTLAESYLAASPLQPPRLLPRIAAKLIDVLVVAAISVLLSLIAWAALPAELVYFVPVACIALTVLGLAAYTVIAEYRSGRTLGKKLMGMQVVRESGARISLGQAIVRQLPFFAQFFWVDALFALFTDRRQRAFELLSKTRAVVILLCLWLMTAAVLAV